MTNGQKILNLLGVATRARKLLVGYNTVLSSLSSKNKVFLVLVAKDCSCKTKDKFVKKCYYYDIILDLSFDSLELSKAIGKGNANIIALSDKGLAESLEKLLKEGVNNES